MTKSDPWHNEYLCPNCEADVSVALPLSRYATCEECHTKLEIHPDADFEDGHWHDHTALSVVDPEREHMARMLKHLTENEERAFDGEDAEEWQQRSEEQGAE